MRLLPARRVLDCDRAIEMRQGIRVPSAPRRLIDESRSYEVLSQGFSRNRDGNLLSACEKRGAMAWTGKAAQFKGTGNKLARSYNT